MKKLALFFLATIVSESWSQELTLIKSINIEEPTEVSLDRGGNIYYATFNGDIIRLDPQLENELIFSPNNPNTTTILEAWQGLRVFSFHKDLQQYRLINRNLSLHEDYEFPRSIVGFAEVATTSYDNNVWLFDQTDFSLKKYGITTNSLLSSTPLEQLLDPDNYEILFCKEYQNRLFLSTRERGILIFDNFGNYIKTFDYKGITFFNFREDSMYFLKNKQLVTFNLYDEQIIMEPLPDQSEWLFVLNHENRTYLFSQDHVALFK
jgi:hypothetical protein